MAERPRDPRMRPDRPERPDRFERPDTPIFAPVIFEDDESPRSPRGGGSGGPGTGEEGDAQLIRVLGVIVLLGIVIAVLVLPPISLLDRAGGGGGDVPANETGIIPRARDSVPETPEGMVAMSRLYDLEAPEDAEGPWTLTVSLTENAEDGRNMAFYSHDGERWNRVSSVVPVEDGASAQGDLDVLPPNLAVLRVTEAARTFAAIVPAGQAPDQAVLDSANALSVLAASPATEGEELSTLQVSEDPFAGIGDSPAAGSELAVYFGVSATADDAALASILASDELVNAHVDEIVQAARAAGAAGVHIDYPGVTSEQRQVFTGFVQALASRLGEEGQQLVVTVTTPAAPNVDPYDWAALLGAADQLWLRTPAERSNYYEQVETLLATRRDDGIDLGNVALVLDRQSYVRGPDGMAQLSLRDALVRASAVEARIEEGGVEPGDPVTVSGVNIDVEVGNSGLLWDDEARAVAYSYSTNSGPSTVWIENRYSAAFRLDMAGRFGLGGVVVADAQGDADLPEVWDPVLSFVESGSVTLRRPYGPYLAPCWRTSSGSLEGAGECWQGGSDAGVVVWRAPEEEGVYDVTLVVSDGTMFIGQQVALRVSDGSEPEPPAEEEADPEPADDPVDEATPEDVEEPDDSGEATEPDPVDEDPEDAEEADEPVDEPVDEPEDGGEDGPPGDGPPGPAGN